MTKFAQSPAGPIAYKTIGEGKPLVMVPGFLSSSDAWLRGGYPDHLSEYELVLIDPLGHGESHKSHDPADYTIDRTVQQITAVLDHAGIDSAPFVGFSRGGLIAAQMVDRRPERVSAAVFGAIPLGRAVKPVLEEQRVGLEPLKSGDWAKYWETFPVPIPPPMQDHFSQTNDPKALAAALQSMLEWADEEPQLGIKDSSIPRIAYFGTGEVFADLLRETLDECGFPYVERSWGGHAETALDAPGVSAIIHEFLQTTNTP